MKRYLKRMWASACILGGLATVGCSSDHYGKVADPCWPDRYTNEARQLTTASFEPQVMNGHILDLTLWNTPIQHFDMGTAKLSPSGMDKLDQLARRRPTPDSRIFIQTARDLQYNAEKPEEYATKRVELDNARVAAVKKYLEISLTGRPMSFDVQVHDPAYPGIAGASPRVIVPPPAARIGAVGGAGGLGGGAGGAPGAGGAVGVPQPGTNPANTGIAPGTPSMPPPPPPPM